MAWPFNNPTNPKPNSGWETGDPLDIYRRFKTPGTQTPAMFGGFPISDSSLNAPTGPQPNDATGAMGDPGMDAAEWGGIPIPRAPSENAMQRQQSEAQDVKQISPQRRYFWGTGRIDARPTQSPNNTTERFLPPTDFDATFGANRQHMGSAGTSWAKRQFSNQQAERDVREQRGLSPY